MEYSEQTAKTDEKHNNSKGYYRNNRYRISMSSVSLHRSPSNSQMETTAPASPTAADAVVQPADAVSNTAKRQPEHVWATATSSRERIPGSALVPGCVQWSDDGRLAVVSDASIMIATFKSRELELYLQQSPAVSKSFIFLPESTHGERVPLVLPVFQEVGCLTSLRWLLPPLTSSCVDARSCKYRPQMPAFLPEVSRTFC